MIIDQEMVDRVRRFAGADPDEDPAILKDCLYAAEAWYIAAGVDFRSTSPLYKYWLCSLAAWMYDHRGDDDPDSHIPAYIVASVHQLRPIASCWQFSD